MKHPHTVFLDFDSLSPGDLEIQELIDVCPAIVLHGQTDPGDTVERIRDAEIVLSNKVVLDRAVLQSAPSLRLVCVAATGTNHVDLDAARERGIAVTNVRDYATQSVAEHVLMLMLALGRNLLAYRQSVQQGEWHRNSQFCLMHHPVMELAGKTIGIVGYGTLGQGVARLAKAIGMKVLIAKRPGQETFQEGRVILNELLSKADVVSLHCPLTPATENLIAGSELRRMKPTALLINTARGGIVNEADLLEALQQGWIAGAGIDVLVEEPPSAMSILVDTVLPKLIVTPHMAWASQSARQTLLNQLVDILLAWPGGASINRVI